LKQITNYRSTKRKLKKRRKMTKKTRRNEVETDNQL